MLSEIPYIREIISGSRPLCVNKWALAHSSLGGNQILLISEVLQDSKAASVLELLSWPVNFTWVKASGHLASANLYLPCQKEASGDHIG